MTIATQLQFLAATGRSLGYPREIESEPAGYDCPQHDAPVLEQRLDTIGGWQAVLVCPLYDGTCRYSPDAAPRQIEPPDTSTEPATAATPADTGGF